MQSLAHRILFKVSRPTFFHVVVLTRVALGALLLSGCATTGASARGAAEEPTNGASREDLERSLDEARVRAEGLEVELAATRLALLERETRVDDLAVTTARLEGELELHRGVADELGRSLERLAARLRELGAERSRALEEREAFAHELSEANSELTRVGAQLEEVVLEAREKASLQRRLEETLGELTALRRQSVVDRVRAKEPRSGRKTSG